MSGSDRNRGGIPIELLRLYAEGLVTPEQATEIEARLAASETDRLILEGIRAEKADFSGDIDFMATKFEGAFNHTEVDTDSTLKSDNRRYPPFWPLLALAATLLLFFMLLPFGDKPTADEIVTAQLAEPYKLQTFAGPTEIEVEAIEAYRAGNFEQAALIFSRAKMLPESKAYFYYALSELYANRFDEASKKFIAIRDSSSPYANHAKWFLSMSLIKEGELVRAREQLAKIAAGEYQYKLAQQLLKKLD